MTLYILYRIGYFLAMSLPLNFSYGLARFVGGLCYAAHRSDRASIIKNMGVITGRTANPRALRRMARELYRNFAKYLVDFFPVCQDLTGIT